MSKSNRRQFLQASAVAVTTLTLMKKAPAENIFEINAELEETNIIELQEAMKTGKMSATQITQKYLERIKEIDGKLNSVIELNPEALEIAGEMDKERKQGKLRSKMHGIPILIK